MEGLFWRAGRLRVAAPVVQCRLICPLNPQGNKPCLERAARWRCPCLYAATKQRGDDMPSLHLAADGFGPKPGI